MSKIIQKTVIVWFIAIITSILVSGCGGGGGGGSSGSPILGQNTNIAAPNVVAVSPANNDTNVSYTLTNITAEFSMPMDLTTLTTTSFTLLDENDLSAPVSGVNYANKVAELTLSADLLQNTVYTATISTSAKSSDGIALLNDYVWTFTTGQILDTIPPEVTSTSPQDNATNVSITKLITATFSEEMMPSSITAITPATFSVKETVTSASIDGDVTYSVINKIAAFKPTLNLTADTSYTATITTVAKDLAGNEMLNDYNWIFTTTATPTIPPELVALGLSSTYGIAATAGITNTPTFPRTQIDGNVVLNPTAECNGVPVDGAGGIGLCGGPDNVPLINGIVVSKTPPYPDATTAQNITDDLRAAYLSITPANMPGGTAIAAGTTLGAPTGDALVEGDNLFYTGVYTSNTSILITGDLTLDAQGDSNATFIFQSASTVGTMPAARILLVGGAKASNVYWQAGSAATLQTNTTWNGNILAYSDITMVNGTSSCGRLFAGAFTDGAFVFDSNHVSVPGNVNAPGGCE